MTTHRTVKKIGGSLAVLIPRDVAEMMNVTENSPVRLSVVGRQLQGHVFMDGNKRTASASTLTFLVSNGRKPKLSMKDTASIMRELQQRVEGG